MSIGQPPEHIQEWAQPIADPDGDYSAEWFIQPVLRRSRGADRRRQREPRPSGKVNAAPDGMTLSGKLRLECGRRHTSTWKRSDLAARADEARALGKREIWL